MLKQEILMEMESRNHDRSPYTPFKGFLWPHLPSGNFDIDVKVKRVLQGITPLPIPASLK